MKKENFGQGQGGQVPPFDPPDSAPACTNTPTLEFI